VGQEGTVERPVIAEERARSHGVDGGSSSFVRSDKERVLCGKALGRTPATCTITRTVSTNGILMYRVVDNGLAVVVGGGRIAARKARLVHNAGFRVRVVAPSIDSDILAHERIEREFQPMDLHGASLVFSATDEQTINHEVAVQARSQGILVNVADDPDVCDFYLPALIEHGDLLIGISTRGRCPGYAAQVRRVLGETVGPEWGDVLEVLACVRQWTRKQPNPIAWESLLEDPLMDACRRKDRDALNHWLSKRLGEGVTLETIGANLGG
jgi:precorrin-2 dehydrogenase/sirohydrochlorin ferrochelatase